MPKLHSPLVNAPNKVQTCKRLACTRRLGLLYNPLRLLPLLVHDQVVNLSDSRAAWRERPRLSHDLSPPDVRQPRTSQMDYDCPGQHSAIGYPEHSRKKIRKFTNYSRFCLCWPCCCALAFISFILDTKKNLISWTHNMKAGHSS